MSGTHHHVRQVVANGLGDWYMVKYGVYITLGKHCGSSTKTIHNIGIVQGVSRDVYPMIMGQKTLA